MQRPSALTAAIWILRILCAAILAQTLFFKFTGAPESRYIFERLGMEPWGRIGTGVAELIAVAMLLTPRVAHLGALFSLAIISGAVMSHLTRLGIAIQNDGGLLFGLALMVLLASLSLVVLERRRLAAEVRRAFMGRRPTTPAPT